MYIYTYIYDIYISYTHVNVHVCKDYLSAYAHGMETMHRIFGFRAQPTLKHPKT